MRPWSPLLVLGYLLGACSHVAPSPTELPESPIYPHHTRVLIDDAYVDPAGFHFTRTTLTTPNSSSDVMAWYAEALVAASWLEEYRDGSTLYVSKMATCPYFTFELRVRQDPPDTRVETLLYTGSCP